MFVSLDGLRLELRSDEKKENLITNEIVRKRINTLEDQIENLQSQVNLQEKLQYDAFSSISLTIARIASVFLAVYLIQILVGFTRYQFRVSDHLDAVADALEISGGDPDHLSKIALIVTTQRIEFGKMPKTPTEQSVELIKELVSKIPNR